MQIDIITLFPKMFEGPLTESIVNRAQKKRLVNIKIHQLRNWAVNKHGTVDGKPYGGGAGMVMRVDVAYAALKNIVCRGTARRASTGRPYIILPTPSGKKFNQAMARRLAKKKNLVFLCPHYEGYDHRIESLVDEKISIGDYVLTGGELPVMAMVDAVVRLVPGVIKKESLREESFGIRRGEPVARPEKRATQRVVPTERYLEYPQYTRPEVFEMLVKGKKIKKRVPKVLLSGDHGKIEKWRKEMAQG